MTLLLYTGMRRQSLVRLGPSNVRDGRLVFTPPKTQCSTNVTVDIPIHPELQAVLDTLPETATFISQENGSGRPVTPESFTNWCRRMVQAAELRKGISAHWMRKAVLTRLADTGATPHEIMSVSGHATLEEVERYTKAANRRRLATEAASHLGVGSGKSVKL